MKFNLENRFIQWYTLLFLAVIWGSSFIMMKRGLESFTDDQVAAYRIFIAFIILLPFSLKDIKQVNRSNITPLILVGLFGVTIPAFLFTLAQTQIDSSLAGILNALVPLFALIIGLVFFKTVPKTLSILGVLAGLVGAAGLIILTSTITLDRNALYSLFAIAGSVCYAISVNIIKHYLKGLRSTLITAFPLLIYGPAMGVYLYFTDFSDRVITEDSGWENLSYITLLGTLSTGMAVIIFNMLIKKTTVLFATSVTYLIPVIAIVWGIKDGEAFSLWHFALILLILGGVYLVNHPSNQKS